MFFWGGGCSFYGKVSQMAKMCPIWSHCWASGQRKNKLEQARVEEDHFIFFLFFSLSFRRKKRFQKTISFFSRLTFPVFNHSVCPNCTRTRHRKNAAPN
jgi:hypothetical protein